METLATGLGFAEGPRWYGGRLVFSDIKLQRVHALSPGGSLETLHETPGRPSGLGWLPDGRLLAVSMLDQTLLREEQGALRPFADVSATCNGSAANDMVVDAAGRAYIGNMGFDYEAGDTPCGTKLARVDPDGSVHVAADELWAPNGMALTPDGGTLIVAESAAMKLTAFDVAANGDLSGRRVYAPLPEGGATPDGICLDAEGAVWCASPTTRAFLRIREGGEVAESVQVDDRVAIACVLGGEDRRTLYLLSSDTMSIDHAQAGSARIDACQVSVPGAGTP